MRCDNERANKKLSSNYINKAKLCVCTKVKCSEITHQYIFFTRRSIISNLIAENW